MPSDLVRVPVVASLILGLAATSVAAQQSAPPPDSMRSVRMGVFTAGQAERGETTFNESCSMCHAPAQYSDGSLLASWSGRTVHDLFERVRATMPYDSPGSLKRQEYADVLAYLCSLSGLPAGETELKGDASLKQIRIEPPEK